MTKRDYQLIADVLRHGRSDSGDGRYAVGYLTALDDISRDVADALKLDNPRFNRATFLQACSE